MGIPTSSPDTVKMLTTPSPTVVTNASIRGHHSIRKQYMIYIIIYRKHKHRRDAQGGKVKKRYDAKIITMHRIKKPPTPENPNVIETHSPNTQLNRKEQTLQPFTQSKCFHAQQQHLTYPASAQQASGASSQHY